MYEHSRCFLLYWHEQQPDYTLRRYINIDLSLDTAEYHKWVGQHYTSAAGTSVNASDRRVIFCGVQ